MAGKRDNAQPRKTHPLRWIVEEWETHPTFLEKRMFGCHAAYLHGRMMLVLADGEEPWNGLLVCTSRVHHAALTEAFPALSPHPVLGKWLYLSRKHEAFETLAPALAKRARRNDPLLGIEPGQKKPARKMAKTGQGLKGMDGISQEGQPVTDQGDLGRNSQRVIRKHRARLCHLPR